MWEVAAGCDDVFLDSEERYARAATCSSAHLDSLVGVVACASGVGMAGKTSCWVDCCLWAKWMSRAHCVGDIGRHGKICGFQAGEMSLHAGGSLVVDVAKAFKRGWSSSWVGLGDAFQFSRGAFSLKGASLSRSSLRRSGAACSFALCCKMFQAR